MTSNPARCNIVSRKALGYNTRPFDEDDLSIPHHLSGRFGKPRGWRRRATLVVLLIGLSLLSAYVWLTRPQRLAAMTSELLTNLTSADVDVQSARISLNGKIHLGRVTFNVPGLEGEAGELFEAQEVEMTHDVIHLFRGQFVPRSLTFINPTLHLTEIPGKQQFNYDYLRRDAATDERRDVPATLPDIFIRGGRMKFGELSDAGFTAMGSLNLSGNLTQDVDQPHSYTYILRQEQETGTVGPVLSGSLDLDSLTVQGQVERFSFQGPQRNILPKQFRAWWDSFEPQGNFPTVRFGYDPEHKDRFQAELMLEDVELTLGFLAARPRVQCTSGKFVIRDEQIQVIDLTGEFEQFRYVINGQIKGFTADATLSLSAKLSGVVPDQPRYVPWFPDKVQQVFHRFTPTGRIDATVLLNRPEPGAMPSYSGYLAISDAKVLDARFPYPLTNVNGQFNFDDTSLTIRSLHGEGPTGAKTVVTGRIAPLEPDAEVKLNVATTHLPIDEVLIQSLHPKARKVFDYLMHLDTYAAMTADEGGLIQSAKQRTQRAAQLEKLRTELRRLSKSELRDVEAMEQAEKRITALERQLQRPVFDLGGTVQATTTVHRPAGPDREWDVSVDVDLAGASTLMKFWKYPLRVVSGGLHIERDKVELTELRIEGLTGAVGVVKGGYYRDMEDIRKRLSPRITFVGAELPIDPLLLYAIPDEPAEWLARLNIEGKIDVAGEIFRGDHGHHDFVIRPRARGATVTPWGGNYKIENVDVDITTTRYDLKIDKAEGSHGSTAFSLTGDAAWGRDTAGRRDARADLKIFAKGLNLDDPVLDLIDHRDNDVSRVRALFDRHNPAGTFDAELLYHARSNSKDSYQLSVMPHTLDLDVQKQRIRLTDMHGKGVITPGLLVIEPTRAAYADGQLQGQGRITFDKHPTIDLKFDARNAALDPMTRAVLPRSVVQTIDDLKLEGSYEIHDAHLRIDPEDGAHPDNPRTAFDCVVNLNNATATIGLPVTEMTGQMRIASVKEAGTKQPTIDMKFSSPRVRVADRLLAPVRFHAYTDENNPTRLIIQELIGDCYGGKLIGTGEVRLDESQAYAVNLTIQNAALDPFTNPRKHDPKLARRAPDPDTINDNATLSGELAMTGRIHEASSRSGRGRFEILDASFYRVPVIHAMLHLLNLSMPNSSSFKQVQSRFMIEGDTVTFESIEFEAPTLMVYGKGEMDYQTQALDLNMSVRNPDGINLGPVSDLLKVFKDELVHIHIGGTLEDPKASLRSFPIIKRGWKSILGGMQSGVDIVNPLARSGD